MASRPVKSSFFSAVACLRNFWTFTVFGMVSVWPLSLAYATGVAIVVSLLGNVELINAILFPVGLAMAAMFFTSF